MTAFRKEDIVRAANGYAVLVNDLADNAKNASDQLAYQIGRTQRKLEVAAKLIDRGRLKILRESAGVDAALVVADYLDDTLDIDDFVRPVSLATLQKVEGLKQTARWVSLLDGPFLTDEPEAP